MEEAVSLKVPLLADSRWTDEGRDGGEEKKADLLSKNIATINKLIKLPSAY